MPDLGALAGQLQDLATRLDGLVRALAFLSNPALWVEAGLRGVVADLYGFFDGYVLATTDIIAGRSFTQESAIMRVEPAMAVIANASLGAVIVWGGYHMMWSHSVRNLYTVRHLLPRILLAVVLINFSMPLFQAAVDFENSICAVIKGIPEGFSVQHFSALVPNNDPGGVPVATLLTLAALFAGYAILACAYAIRYALLVILAITAPLAALLFILPDTHHWAREWGSLFVTTLFMQPIQLLILVIGFQLENDFGRGSTQSPIRHLFALACLVIAFKVPGALHSTSQIGGRAMTAAHHYAMLALHPRHVA